MLKLGHVLFGRRFLGEPPGQHKLGLKDGAAGLGQAVEGCRHPAVQGMVNPALQATDHLPGLALVPTPIELFGGLAELYRQIIGKVGWIDLAPLLPPQPNQRGLVVAHDDAGIRPTNETAPIYC